MKLYRIYRITGRTLDKEIGLSKAESETEAVDGFLSEFPLKDGESKSDFYAVEK